MIDLRSDTVTKPTRAMRDAMANADVGDDVYGEDPTVLALEARVAELLGKEAALFVSSGSMGNQLAIAVQTRHGDEVIVGEGAHPVFYEAGAGPALSGVQFAVAGPKENRIGLFTAAEMEAVVKPRAYYTPRTSLVCVENTHNRAGGRVFPQDDAIAIAERAHALGLGVHLDGARLWNAAVATDLSERELAAPFDTVSVCFSKGLGAPAGSAFVSTRENVESARRFRKMWGGGMRQVGILAAGALYALEHHRARLRDDHEGARKLAERLANAEGLSVDVAHVETNIVNIDTRAPADALSRAAKNAGLAISASGAHRLRAVVHLDVSRDDLDRAATILAHVAKDAR
jgi:threonine aldolase